VGGEKEEMIIAGLDVSLTSPGIVKARLDDTTLDIIELDWCGFTTVIKDKKKCPSLFLYKKFNNYFERSIWMLDHILSFMFNWGGIYKVADYVAIEDYAFSSTGKSFHIGGFTEMVKMEIYKKEISMRLYDITLIKKLATWRGNADKLAMYDEFMNIPLEHRIDISKLPPVTKPHGKSPTSDIIDAYYIMSLLHTELKLRRGLLSLRDMSENMNWIFNRVTKTSDENILTRDFIKKV
jgi:hypothetical protein